MARRRLIAGIAFAVFGWGLLLSHPEGLAQNRPATRAATPAAVTDKVPGAAAETQAGVAK